MVSGTLPFDGPPRDPGVARGRLAVERLYVEPAAAALPRGQQVLDRFPDAERIEVPSHWNIPGLHGNPGNVADWNRIKRTSLVLGTLKSPRVRPNGRSADFIAPSTANGCAMSCAYCYVPGARATPTRSPSSRTSTRSRRRR